MGEGWLWVSCWRVAVDGSMCWGTLLQDTQLAGWPRAVGWPQLMLLAGGVDVSIVMVVQGLSSLSTGADVLGQLLLGLLRTKCTARCTAHRSCKQFFRLIPGAAS